LYQSGGFCCSALAGCQPAKVHPPSFMWVKRGRVIAYLRTGSRRVPKTCTLVPSLSGKVKTLNPRRETWQMETLRERRDRACGQCRLHAGSVLPSTVSLTIHALNTRRLDNSMLVRIITIAGRLTAHTSSLIVLAIPHICRPVSLWRFGPKLREMSSLTDTTSITTRSPKRKKFGKKFSHVSRRPYFQVR
jgi:hypothetical protein